MKIFFLLLSLSLSLFCSSLSAGNLPDNPVADPEAVVVFGNARFTVLTPRLLRMEWSEDGVFEDKASLTVINRNLPVPDFKVIRRNRKLMISTDYLTLTYTGSGKFSKENLNVYFKFAPDSRNTTRWYPGMDDSANLLGTTRTLDKCDGFSVNEPYDKGVISRDGWAVIDDSQRHLLAKDDSDWKEWVETRPAGNRLDYYLFLYGHDYKAAICDFTRISGKIPLPPKYAFGYWWSRYWQYSDSEFIGLAKQFKALGIPIDVMVIDMDWHETWSMCRKDAPKDEFGERIGWTGYTWQGELFPDPANFLREIHLNGLKTSLNLHPASGIQPYEDCYDRFVADYTSRTDNYDGPRGFVSEDGKKMVVPFRISDQDWTDAYFNSVIHPLEEMGVDFWWLDWQQWKYSRYMEGLNNTFWLNYTFFNDKIRQTLKDGIYAERPMIYHRWGGLGSHRYQIGFSGDTYDTWNVLAYLPYFTSTAANVCYGYWGHDIGGHMQLKDHFTDPELYTRWLQYGVFTPIFKTHSTKSVFLERRMWMFPDYFDSMKQAVRLRYTLSPYIYTAARQAYDSGLSICRPMYYDYPEEELAYSEKEQFMFGDDILATVLCHPRDSVTKLTSRTMWFPKGNDWYDMATGSLYRGGTQAELHYTIDENPYFVKAGAIIPMSAETIGSLQEKTNEINLFVAPGNSDSSARFYEDDGSTQAYDTEYAVTEVRKTVLASSDGGERLCIKVLPREGSYRDMEQTRRIRLTLGASYMPEKVSFNGVEIPYSRFAAYESVEENCNHPSWTYDGHDLSVLIYLPDTAADQLAEIECTYASEAVSARADLYGKKGLIRRMFNLTPALKYIIRSSPKSLSLTPPGFLKVAQAGSYLTEHPSEAVDYVKSINLEEMVAALRSIYDISEDFIDQVKVQSNL